MQVKTLINFDAGEQKSKFETMRMIVEIFYSLSSKPMKQK
jgi:hypothetical protein